MNKFLNSQTSNISDSSERRKVENVYALKSIQLDRVKPMFVEELKNEIDILKVGVGFLCFLEWHAIKGAWLASIYCTS